MKVIVDNTYVTTNMMKFRLLSINMQFRCIAPPKSENTDYDKLVKPNEAEIIFDDSRELDILIKMLKEFRDCCYYNMGEWKRGGYK